jgi:hypothetical protein
MQKNKYAGLVVTGLAVGLLLDIKYKGLVYRLFVPKKVQG